MQNTDNLYVKVKAIEDTEVGKLLAESSAYNGENLLSVDQWAKATGTPVEEFINSLLGMQTKGFISLEWFKEEAK